MRVRISYSPRPWEIGTVRDMPDDEARLLIREGRARPADDGPDDEVPPITVRATKPAKTAPVKTQVGTEQPPQPELAA
jgi:hypothetical protein